MFGMFRRNKKSEHIKLIISNGKVVNSKTCEEVGVLNDDGSVRFIKNLPLGKYSLDRE